MAANSQQNRKNYTMTAKIFKTDADQTKLRLSRQVTKNFQLELIDAIEPGYSVQFKNTTRYPLTQQIYDIIRSRASAIGKRKRGMMTTTKLPNGDVVVSRVA